MACASSATTSAGEVVVEQVQHRHVDRHRQFAPVRPPLLLMAEDMLEHIPRQEPGQAAALGSGKEHLGMEQAVRGMLPAQQRLDGGDPPRHELHLRLVVHDQLLGFERTTQISDEHEPRRRVIVVIRVVEREAAARTLCHVHGDVGTLEQLLDRVAVLREDGDSDARLDVQRQALNRERVAQLELNPGDELLGEPHIDVGEQEAELVAADSRHGVLTARARLKPLPELVQQRVARVVTECVVDLLEAIEIHQQNGVRRSGALRPLQTLRDPVVEEAPVREPGERVVQRLVEELRLRILALDELRELACDDGEGEPQVAVRLAQAGELEHAEQLGAEEHRHAERAAGGLIPGRGRCRPDSRGDTVPVAARGPSGSRSHALPVAQPNVAQTASVNRGIAPSTEVASASTRATLCSARRRSSACFFSVTSRR